MSSNNHALIIRYYHNEQLRLKAA